MKNLILIFCFFISVSSGYAQEETKQITSIDSLVNLIESGKDVTQIIRCDTNAIWETGHFSVYCHHFYHNNNKLLKAVVQITTFPIPVKPLQKGMAFRYYAFYFYNDALIKAVKKDSLDSPTAIDEFYFTPGNLSGLELLRSNDPEKYKRIIGYTVWAKDFLTRYKENRID